MLVKEIISKPSEALQAMVDGLIKQSERPDFKIEMATFGSFYAGICFGCAATCAIQQLYGKDINTASIRTCGSRAEFFGSNKEDLRYFENAINDARVGEMHLLFTYFDLIPVNTKDKCHFLLTDNNWKDQLPSVIKYISYLQSKGY